MKRFLTILLFIFSTPAFAEENSPSREYPFTIGEPLDSRTIVGTGIALNKLSYDVFNTGIAPKLPDSVVPWIEPAWSFFWTFNFTMWPHDYGHWVRANQVGGDFIIESYRFPFPIATMVIPPGATSLDKTMMSIGGFEINTLMRRYTENRYYETGYRDAEDLVHGFIQTIMFSMYTNLIAPADPTKADTWNNTYGDPVDVVKQVFEHYTGRPAVNAGVVDPELITLYREYYWANLLTVLLDPMTYKMAHAFGEDMRQQPRVHDPWLYQSDNFSWAYTSTFNPGALGYEIRLTQHLKINNHYMRAYIQTGRPFKNRSVGFAMPRFYQLGNIIIGSEIDLWDQDIYGRGNMFTLNSRYRISRSMEMVLDLHWKDDGYIVGHRLEKDAGALLWAVFYW